MKSFREMRREAWKTVTTRWSFRLLSVIGIFMVLGGAVFGPLADYYKRNSIQTWGMFRSSQLELAQSGLELSVPSSQQFWSMTWASGFESFLQFLFQALIVFGIISVALKAVRRDDRGWFGSAFGAFKSPLEMLWLNLLMSIRIVLWALLFVIPGIIAAFRYAMAWYVKVDHPDYSAPRCLAESGRLMKGHKRALFLFGLSYIGWIALGFGGMAAVSAFGWLFPFLLPFLMPLAFAAMMFVVVYIVFGQAVFYSEVKRISENENTESPEAEASAGGVES